MRRFGPILIATVAILTAGADAQVHDPPLFAAFKAFRVDTGASPNAVKSAVEAAGGKQIAANDSTVWPFAMTVTAWDITTGGNHMFVSAGIQQVLPAQNRPEENSDNCIVSSFVNEDASIEAIRNWVGVPPALIFGGNPINYIFEYQELDSVRSTLPGDKITHDRSRVEGRTWGLTMLQAQDGANVHLVHILVPPIPR